MEPRLAGNTRRVRERQAARGDPGLKVGMRGHHDAASGLTGRRGGGMPIQQPARMPSKPV